MSWLKLYFSNCLVQCSIKERRIYLRWHEAQQIIMCGRTFPLQVEAVKEMLYQLEETYLKKKALRATKKQNAEEKKALKKASLRSPVVLPQGQPNALADPQPPSSNKWAPFATPQTLIFCQEVGHSTPGHYSILTKNKWALRANHHSDLSFLKSFHIHFTTPFSTQENPFLTWTYLILGIYSGLISSDMNKIVPFHLCNQFILNMDESHL